MPRSPTLNRDIRDARRDAILSAAFKLFARHGLTDTKIGDIAEAAGLSHGLVYHYFPSKAAIFEEIIVRRREEAASRVAWAAEDGSYEALHAMLEFAIEDARKQADLTLMASHALLGDAVPEAVRRRLRAGGQSAFERSVALFEAAQRRGDVDAGIPAARIASALFCCLRGVAFMCQGARGLNMPSPTADTLLRMISARPAGALDRPIDAPPAPGSKAPPRARGRASPTGSSARATPRDEGAASAVRAPGVAPRRRTKGSTATRAAASRGRPPEKAIVSKTRKR